MNETYRWPDPAAVKTINLMMSLPATGNEQDWEIELADSDRLDEALGLLRTGGLDLEARSALALLILHSLTYHRGGDAASTLRIDEVRSALEADAPVRARMKEYWSGDFGENERVVSAVLA